MTNAGNGTFASAVSLAGSPPTIAAVQDAASNTPNIAQGSLLQSSRARTSLPPRPDSLTFRVPRSSGGVKVTFTPAAGGAGTDTYLIYVGTGQINALLPSTVPVGNYNVTVTNGTVSAPFFAQVVASKAGPVHAGSERHRSGRGAELHFAVGDRCESPDHRQFTTESRVLPPSRDKP